MFTLLSMFSTNFESIFLNSSRSIGAFYCWNWPLSSCSYTYNVLPLWSTYRFSMGPDHPRTVRSTDCTNYAFSLGVLDHTRKSCCRLYIWFSSNDPILWVIHQLIGHFSSLLSPERDFQDIYSPKPQIYLLFEMFKCLLNIALSNSLHGDLSKKWRYCPSTWKWLSSENMTFFHCSAVQFRYYFRKINLSFMAVVNNSFFTGHPISCRFLETWVPSSKQING